MPKRIAPLSDVQVKNARSKEKDYKLQDGCGLYLLVTRSGGKLCRLDYRHEDKRNTMALGAYPAVSLADTRKRRDEAKKLLANGIDPVEDRKAAKETQKTALRTFEIVAREWYGKNEAVWSAGHAVTVKSRLERKKICFQMRSEYFRTFQLFSKCFI